MLLRGSIHAITSWTPASGDGALIGHRRDALGDGRCRGRCRRGLGSAADRRAGGLGEQGLRDHARPTTTVRSPWQIKNIIGSPVAA